MTNLNINIPDKTHKKIKLLSVIENTSLKELIIRTLKQTLDEKLKDNVKNEKK